MRRELTRLAIVAVMAAVVLQGVGAGFAASQVGADEPTADEPTSAADEIYVEGDGDAVLVYDSAASSSDSNRSEFGVDVSENLAYLLVTDDVEGTPEVNGALAVTANRTAIWADGNLSMPKPPSLQSFTLDASGVTTAEQSRSDLSVSATVADQSGMTQVLDGATTDGSVTMTANRLQASGSLDVDTAIPMPASGHTSLDLGLAETSSGYVLEVNQSRTVRPEYTAVPENAEQARQVLERQFQGLAAQYGGSASVELDSFSRTPQGEQVRVQQDYTVQLEGIDEGIGQLIRVFGEDSRNIDSQQAERLATGVEDVEVNQLSLDYTVDRTGMSGSFSVDVSNYSSLALAYFDVLGSSDSDSAFAGDVERMKTQFEAQRASGLEQQFTWSGSLAPTDADAARAEFEIHASNSNWAAYVDELQARGVPLLEANYEISGSTTSDRLRFSGNGSVAGDQLYAELTRGAPSAEEAPEAAAMMTAFRESRPQKAKLVATYGADGVRLEAGAAFGDLSVLRDAISEQTELPPVNSVVGRMDQGSGETVVRVSNAASGDASESSVRSLAYVDEGTEIYMPGEGERDFPSMDVERAEAFLDLENTTSESSGPGFGPVAALVAVVAAALFLARRD